MKFQTHFYPETQFGGFTHVDGTLIFYSRVNALLSPSSRVVDVGCGRGVYGEDPVPYRRDLRILRGKCAQVLGIDVARAGLANPYLDEFRQIEGERWPVEAGWADLCLADNVLEHIPDPQVFLAECHRILKPGGVLCIRTPNLWSYFGLLSRLVPNRQHTTLLQKAKPGLASEDVFPTLYRCNTLPALRKSLTNAGFEAAVYGYEAEPSYLGFSKLAYALGVFLQAYTPNLLRVGLHAFARKKI